MNFIRRARHKIFAVQHTYYKQKKIFTEPSNGFGQHILSTQCLSCCAQRLSSQIPIREKHTLSRSWSLDELSRWQRMKWNMGFHGNLLLPAYKLRQSGSYLYICCADFIDFQEFVLDAGLPDTFSSWFQLLLLHIWMLNVKLSQMGLEGILLKDSAYKSMWHNVEVRLDTFKDLLGSEKRKYMQGFYNSMFLSTMYMDEGLLGSDKQLANSLWISLYSMSKDVDPAHLDLMVEYVRKQIRFHDQLNPDRIMNPGFFPLLPLHGDKLDKEKAEQDFNLLVATIAS